MKIIIIYAHPVPESLNASLRDAMVRRLEGQGHTVQISDLYAMGWKAALDGDDFPNRQAGASLTRSTTPSAPTWKGNRVRTSPQNKKSFWRPTL